VLLHPYNEASWDDQVLKEPQALRVARAVNHLRSTLLSGFTTIRDLGTEGAGYADVGLKQAVEQKIIPGPRMLVATRAIVATRSYCAHGISLRMADSSGGRGGGRRNTAARGPRPDRPRRRRHQGLRDTSQAIKLPVPTYSVEELKLIVETARLAQCPVSAHATTREG